MVDSSRWSLDKKKTYMPVFGVVKIFLRNTQEMLSTWGILLLFEWFHLMVQ